MTGQATHEHPQGIEVVMRRDYETVVTPDARSSREQQLFTRVQQWPADDDWSELNSTALAEIARREGIDFATALLYCRLRESSQHGPLIHQLESTAAPDASHVGRGIRVGILPGGCHQESADSRECLQRVFSEITRLGFDAEIVPVTSFGSLRDNAETIRTWLQTSSQDQTIVVSLSKGGAEVKLCLHEDPQAFQHVRAWINVSGLLQGSEWVSWLLGRRASRLGARCWSWYWGYPFSTLEELRRGPETLLDFDVSIPDHLTAIHIVGFPLAGDGSHRYARRSFRRLADRGPSDGMGIMLGDLTRWQGAVYPVWRADHFLRPPGKDMRDFVGQVLRFVAADS